MSVAGYVKDIKDTVSSVFEGMAITFSHLVRRPMTIQYPDKIPVPIQETLPHRYRGILEVDMDICTGCLACERVCPITCITIGIDANKETKQRVFTHLVRHFVPQPTPLYKPKKGGETDPKLATKVDIGLKYLDEFATPDGGAAAEEK